MAVIKDYYSPDGCHIIVHNDSYRDKSPEDIEEIIDNVSRMILGEGLRRYMEAQTDKNF